MTVYINKTLIMSETTIELIPMTRKEISQAFGMSRITLWRKIQVLQLPEGRIVPRDLDRICQHLRRDRRILINYVNRYGLIPPY